MNTVLSLILLIAGSSLKDDINTVIARYIIGHVSEIEGMPVQTFAENCYTSVNSVVKFCHLLGFSGYADFRNHLMDSMNTRTMQLKKKMDGLSVDDIMHHIVSLSDSPFDQKLLLKQTEELAERIQREGRTFIHGAVFPLNLSQSFAEDCTILGYPVYICQVKEDPGETALASGVHIVVTFSGRMMEASRNFYHLIIEKNNDATLISMKEDEHCSYHVTMPHARSSSYEDLIYLLILDLVLYHLYSNESVS